MKLEIEITQCEDGSSFLDVTTPNERLTITIPRKDMRGMGDISTALDRALRLCRDRMLKAIHRQE